MKKILKFSAKKQAELLKKGEVSSRELVEAYLERIEERRDINAFITISDEALSEAKRIDSLRAGGKNVGPLSGLPVAIKDNIITRGIRTTCASKMLEKFVPPFDATVVEKIKESGGIVLGKTNMDEFAMGSSSEWSIFGAVKNPLDTTLTAGGSSGGSAAAVADFQAPFALGSDTGGSVRLPASFCSIVGFKPTYGRVSRYGLVAFASSLDQIAPLARNVEDIAFLFNIIVGQDERDSTSIKEPFVPLENLGFDISKVKLGMVKEGFGEGVEKRVRDVVIKAIEMLPSAVDEVSVPEVNYSVPIYCIIAPAEASSNLARYDGIRYSYRADGYSNLKDLYIKTRTEGFGEEVKRRIMIGTFVLSSGYYEAYFLRAQKARRLIRDRLDTLFERFDFLVMPTSPTVPFRLGEKLSDPLAMYTSDMLTIIANLGGYPAISLPASKKESIGLQIIAPRMEDDRLLRFAFEVEKVLSAL